MKAWCCLWRLLWHRTKLQNRTLRTSFLQQPQSTPVGLVSSLQAYCGEIFWCEARGSCIPRPEGCPQAPYAQYALSGPSADVCSTEQLERCELYSMPGQVAVWRRGVLFSQGPRVLVDGEVLQRAALFPEAFLDGMTRTNKCHLGVMAFFRPRGAPRLPTEIAPGPRRRRDL